MEKIMINETIDTLSSRICISNSSDLRIYVINSMFRISLKLNSKNKDILINYLKEYLIELDFPIDFQTLYNDIYNILEGFISDINNFYLSLDKVLDDLNTECIGMIDIVNGVTNNFIISNSKSKLLVDSVNSNMSLARV